MNLSKNICVLVDDSILTSHHGVRRYLMSLCSSLQVSNHKVHVINTSANSDKDELKLDPSMLIDNGFSGNKLAGSSRKEIIEKVRSGEIYQYKQVTVASSSCEKPDSARPRAFDLCIVGAPWMMGDLNKFPKASSYICVAYDAIPNLYYFDRPDDIGLHHFAHEHYKGYVWADEQADGIFCISALTARQCDMFGFGRLKGLSVFPPMVPPGYQDIDLSMFDENRGRVAVLAAPFDRRKGLQDLPDLINAGEFDSLRIFGRPRCAHDDLMAFFDQLEIDDVQWWFDVDFKKQVELYASAKVLLFPSLNEGLGFPVLEAYACGTSVLTSNIEPLNTLVLPEDLLAADKTSRLAQVKRRANAPHNPLKYRSFVERLCASNSLDIFKENN